MGNLSVKIAAAALVIGLMFWFWPASESASPSLSAAEIASYKADEAEDSPGAVSGNLPVASINPSRSSLNKQESNQLFAEFNSAVRLLDQNELDEAELRFAQLTKQYPRFVEPHINLAAIATKRGELEQARKLLISASKANNSTARLFESINHLHGAMAAQAYQRALESGQIDKAVVELPILRTLTTDFELAQRVDALEAKLQTQDARLANDTEISKELANLERTLVQEREAFSTRESEFETRISELQAELQDSQRLNQISVSKQAETDNQIDKDVIAKLRIELANLESKLDTNIQELSRLKSENQDLARELATVEQVAIASSARNSEEQADSSAPSPAQIKAAIDRVRSWASSWSNQDLGDYVSHYLPNYASSQLSRQAWVEQRRVRLTNKRFIQVRVSDFDVVATDLGYAVTFRQHYRSNTLDDTITKRLDFRVIDGQGWSSGKISAEQIIRR